MSIHHLHHHVHPDKDVTERLCRIETTLETINLNRENIMSTLQDAQAAQAITQMLGQHGLNPVREIDTIALIQRFAV